jgi:PAS domain S-box-containing protein
MFRNFKISVKIASLIIALSLVAVVAISIFTYRLNVQSAEEKISLTISAVADNRAAQFNQYFDNLKSVLQFLQQSKTFSVPLPEDTASEDSPEVTLLKKIQQAHNYEGVYLTDSKGAILFSSNGKHGDLQDPDGSYFTRASSEILFSRVQPAPKGSFLYASAPFEGKVLVVKVVLDPLFKFLNSSRIGQTAETILAQPDPSTNKVALVSPILFPAKTLLEPSTSGAKEALLSLEGKEGNGTTTDYRGERVMASWRKIGAPGLALITKIDEAEYLNKSVAIRSTYFLAGGTIVLMAIALSMLFSRTLVKPLHEMRNTLDLVSKGVLPEKNESLTKDEFGEMATKVDNLVDMLKGNVRFAQKVGEGKFDAEFKPASENDALGHALINMRDNLVENARQNDERNWIVRGIAEASEILRLHDNLDALGDDIVQFIIKKIGAVQGAFYIVNDDNPKDKLIQIRASFAYGRKKYLNDQFRFAEGLVGQAAIEQDTVLRTEIPSDYVTITSGILGDQKPVCILITPLIANEEVYGVVEFAGLQKFNPSQVKFIQELSQIIARTVFNIKVNDRTRRLLAESQAMSAELKEKQSVLNQNAEEMQATQEELKRSNIQLEEQIQEVGRTQKRMQLLLENASEVITIYEEDGTIRYISPSVESIFGYSQREMQGRKDLDKVHADGKVKFQDMFNHLKSQPEDKYTVQYEYKTKTGEYIWLESTGTNCMSNPAIHGYIVNSRDITERRRAEQEQRMRSKMQALSENSPDLITRLEEGVISYINPVIENYTGHLPAAFLNKQAKETSLDLAILENWLKIVEDVNLSNDKISTEMPFPSVLGKRVMQVNAIPEYNEAQQLESVLVVSHDITERKMIELEIQEKKKRSTTPSITLSAFKTRYSQTHVSLIKHFPILSFYTNPGMW